MSITRKPTHQIILTFELCADLGLNESIKGALLSQVIPDDFVEIIRIEKVQLRRLAIVDAHSADDPMKCVALWKIFLKILRNQKARPTCFSV